MTRVAIMQPTYLPWIGYFGLMRSVDVFIVLDSVQFAKRSWQQRNRIKTANGPTWLSVPVRTRGRREQLIHEVEIDRDGDFPRNHLAALELSYRKAPHFEAYAPKLLDAIGQAELRLVDLTLGLITSIGATLGIATPIRRARELQACGTKAELLAALADEVGADEYVSPPGSHGYLDESDAFQRRGISVRYFEFAHPGYPQRFGDFVPYMSVVDLLFNCGPASASVIATGCVST